MTATFGLDWPQTETELFVVNWGEVARIIDATNAAPIVCTTAVAHGFATDNLVVIVGVRGNRAANGRHQIVVLDPNHFVLRDSTGNGEYVGGGIAQRGLVAMATFDSKE